MDMGESKPERWCGLKDSSWCKQFKNISNPLMARYVYGFIFLAANLLAWSARDELSSISTITKVKGLRVCKVEKECLGANGVLRVSMGCFLFFMMMFWSTTRASELNEARDKWHSGWWSVKIVLWILLTIFPFLLPSALIELYGQIAQFGAGVFLLIQLISIISFINWLNDYFTSETYAERFKIHVMIFAATSYFICLVGIILMYVWYAPIPSCLLNIFFITWSLVLLQLMTSVSIHPKVNGGLLSPGLMGLYVVFLCWCAIRSEPEGDQCIRKAGTVPETDWLNIISFVIGILAIVFATFSTGIDSKSFQLKKSEKPTQENDVPYGYGFFHFVFAVGAMYFAMLLVGWNSHHSMKKWSLDVGWTSAWVRIVNEWLSVCVYLWILIAPVIWKNRHIEST
ncbi:unnamed protein product [Vicia faba]|uniref:Serinc-domain containing serine and sphingolipid biosynthesis protein n=1 Tax=Vicia faba TaxID=3906 RepID=A0AAV0ZAF6_VICFA|nr:unnamed protein product [Vicia faba]